MNLQDRIGRASGNRTLHPVAHGRAVTPHRKAAIRAMLGAATKGPWRWFGNTRTREVYLSTIDRGRVFVMDFVRWGMTNAQPRFQIPISAAPSADADMHGGIMRSIGDLGSTDHPCGPKFEVEAAGRYRYQFAGIGHPDATLIEQAPAIIGELLARIDELEAAGLRACEHATAVPALTHSPEDPKVSRAEPHIPGFQRIGRIDSVGRRSLWMRVEHSSVHAKSGGAPVIELRAGREGDDAQATISPDNPIYKDLYDVLSAARFAAEWEDPSGLTLESERDELGSAL